MCNFTKCHKLVSQYFVRNYCDVTPRDMLTSKADNGIEVKLSYTSVVTCQ